jgi:hypothetical protein
MEIVKCPECGSQVSINAEGCPNCGYPVKAMYAKNKSLFKKHQEKEPDSVELSNAEQVERPVSRIIQEEHISQESNLIGTLGFFMAIASYIPGVVWILSGGTIFLGALVWILLAIAFILSFIGIFVSKTRDIALMGFIICIITAMFAIIYPLL